MAIVTTRLRAGFPSQSMSGRTVVQRARLAARLLTASVPCLPLYGFFSIESSLVARLAVAALAATTFFRPDIGLLTCSALLTVVSVLSVIVHASVSLGEPLVLAFLAAWLLGDAIRENAPLAVARRRILAPAGVFAAIVAASGAAQVAAGQPFINYPWPYVTDVFRFLTGPYVFDRYALPGIADAATVIEGVGLLAAVVVLSTRRPSLPPRLAAMAGLGGLTVAALNLNRFREICVRTPGLFAVLLVDPRKIRFNAAFSDVNAAASYLTMVLLMLVGLAMVARRTRIAWIAAAGIVATALWLNGSRTAPLAAIASSAIVFGWMAAGAGRSRLKRLLPVAALAFVMALLAVWFAAGYIVGYEIRGTVRDRVEFGLAALRATAAHPVFGVGMGRFFTVSDNYITDPEVSRAARRENAHNNLLQILAELGTVGLASFLWLLVVAGRRAFRSLRNGSDPLLAGLLAGLVAFLLTCLFGHPLLTREVSFAFWLTIGIAVARCIGTGAEPETGRPGDTRIRRAAWSVLIACLVASVPLRAGNYLRYEADLGQAAIGFSRWNTDEAGRRYRTLQGRAQFYIPATSCVVSFPVRVDARGGQPSTRLELLLDGRPAGAVQAVRDSWRDARMVLPPRRDMRFRRIELATAPDANAVLRVGKLKLVDCWPTRVEP